MATVAEKIDAALVKREVKPDASSRITDAIARRDQEAALREKHAARPEGGSILDTTLNVVGTVTNPINDLWDAGLQAVGMEPSGRMTDAIKHAVRNTETGFKVEEGLRRTGKEVLALPAQPAAIYGLARAAIDYAFSDDSFAEAMLSDEGKEVVAAADRGDETAIERIRNNPNELLRPGLGFMADVSEAAGEATGVAQRDNSEVPLDEEVMGIIGSSFIGAPGGAISGVTRALVTKYGSHRAMQIATELAQKPAARVLTRVTEAVTPLTLPLTPKNVVVNALGGVAVNDLVRYAMDEPGSLFAEVAEAAKEVDPIDVTTASGAASVATAGIFGLAVLRGRAGRMAQGVVTGRSGPRQTGELNVSVDREIEAELLDADAPLIHLLQDVYGKGVHEPVESVTDAIRLSTRNAGDARVAAMWEEGIRPGEPGRYYTMPGARLKQQADELTVSERRLFDEGMLAEQFEWMTANNRGNPSRWSSADIRTRVRDLHRNLQLNPKLRKMYDDTRLHMREVLEDQHDAGFWTAAQMRELRTRPFVPMIPFDQNPTSRMFDSKARFSNEAVSPFTKHLAGDIKDFELPVDAIGKYERQVAQAILENRARDKFVRTFGTGARQLMVTDRARFKELFPRGLPIRRLYKGERGKRTIDVWRDGEKHTYVVGDPLLHNALQFSPHSVVQLLSSMRRGLHAGTTGEGNPLFAPTSFMLDAFFSSALVRRRQVAGYLDSALHRAGVRNNIVGDIVSAAVRVPDALLTGGVGIGRGLSNHLMRELAMQLDGRLGQLSIAGIIPPAMRARMSQRAVQRFHKALSYANDWHQNSTMSDMAARGYAPGRFTADVGDMERGKLDDVMRTLFEQWLPGRTYRGMLNSVRDGYRMEFYALNRAHLLRNDAAYQKAVKQLPTATGHQKAALEKQIRAIINTHSDRAAREAREIGSDPTRAGQNTNFTKVTSAMPYSNVAVQALGTVAKAMANDQQRSAGLVLASHAAYSIAATAAIIEMGGGEWWYEQVPDKVRTRMLPVNRKYMESLVSGEPYTFDPKDVTLLDVGQEMAFFRAPVTAALETMIGFDSPLQWRDPRIQTRMFEMGAALRQLVPWGVPPAGNVISSVWGTGPIMEERFFEGENLFPQAQRGEGSSSNRRETGANKGFMTDRLADVLGSFAGGFGRWVADMSETVDATLVLEPESDITDHLDKLWDRFTFEAEKGVTATVWNKALEPSRGSPTIQRAYDMRTQMQPLIEDVELFRKGVVGQRDDAIDLTELPMRLPDKVQDPMLQDQLVAFTTGWNNDPVIGRAFTELANLRTKYNGIEANHKLPPARRQFLLDGITMQIEQEADTVIEQYTRLEDEMRGVYGPGWTLGAMASAVHEDLQKAPPDMTRPLQ